jgi:hypothetical protein
VRRQPHVSGQGAILLSAPPHSLGSKSLSSCARHLSRVVGAWRSLPGQKKEARRRFFAESKKRCGNQGTDGPRSTRRIVRISKCGGLTSGAARNPSRIGLPTRRNPRVHRYPTDDGGTGHNDIRSVRRTWLPMRGSRTPHRKVARDGQHLSQVAESPSAGREVSLATESLDLTTRIATVDERRSELLLIDDPLTPEV